MPYRSVEAVRHRVQPAQHDCHIVGYRMHIVERTTQRMTDHVGGAGTPHDLLTVLFALDGDNRVSCKNILYRLYIIFVQVSIIYHFYTLNLHKCKINV